jgi:hypothetical protein
MKKVLLLTLVMVMGASLAVAQPGVFGTYADAGALNCNVVDAVPGLLTVWVVHTLTGGATAGQFSAPVPACMIGGLWLADGTIGPAVGTTQIGIGIGYGGCLGAPIAAANISIFANGLTTPCCAYPVLPDPNTGLIEMVDCTATKLPAAGIANTVNGNSTCNCATVPTEESTWGAVKSLYHTE